MPYTPKRPCSQPGCGRLVKAGKCEAHDRGTSSQRGYGGQWRRFRRWYISNIVARDPVCCDCRKPFMATSEIELHHVFMVEDRPDVLFDEQNIRALCRSCHATRTFRGE